MQSHTHFPMDDCFFSGREQAEPRTAREKELLRRAQEKAREVTCQSKTPKLELRTTA